jgi:hypothetical protein
MPRKTMFRARLKDPTKFTDEHKEALLTGFSFFGGYAHIKDEDARLDAMHADWLLYRDELLPEFLRANPGQRPWSWWQWDAPDEVRRRLKGGHGTSLMSKGLWFGCPRGFAQDYSIEDPPRYESERAYLERHNLLTEAER